MAEDQDKEMGEAESANESANERSSSRGREGRDRGGERGERGGRGGRGREGREGRGGKGRRERSEPESEFQETLIDVYRCSATVKGGRRLSFGALVTVGDHSGRVSIGYGKSKEVPGAIQKAVKRGRRGLTRYPITPEGSVPHKVRGRFGASEVLLIPAAPGTGVIAGAAVKAILEATGVKNILTKSYGSTNTRNLTKATINALEQLRSKDLVSKLRGVEL